MFLDDNTARVLLAAFGVVNTALLVWQAVRLGQVHTAVNGAQTAAIAASRDAGVAAGILSVTSAPPAAPQLSTVPPTTQP
jgi:hypothetical protein